MRWSVDNRQIVSGQKKPNPVEFAPGHSKCLALVRFGHYALIANPIIPKNLKIFVPYQFSVEFMSKKADKLQKILVLHPKIRNQR